MINISNPHAQFESQKQAIERAVARVLSSGTYISGVETKEFERELAAFVGCEHAISVGSGTDALYLALLGLGIGAGDEVITVSHTALATVAAIVQAGATPVLVDVDPVTMTLDPDQIDSAVSENTKAILPIHLYGHPADMTRLQETADRHGLFVIEDCAQAAGAQYKDKRVGSLGTIGCFSFYPTKNLGALGDAGALTTNDGELASRIQRLKQYGWDDNRLGQEPGVNSRMDELQAAILREKLPLLDAHNEQRRTVAKVYSDTLQDLGLTLPGEADDCHHVYHLYVIQSENREAIRQALAAQNINAGIHYPFPAHLNPGYGDSIRVVSTQSGDSALPVTESLAERVLSLPMYPELEQSAHELADSIREAIRSCA